VWDLGGFLDDKRPAGSMFLDLPVLGGLAAAATRFGGGHSFINVIGSDTSYRSRPDVVAATGLSHERFATLVHPAANVSPHAALGCGAYVCHGANIGGGVTVGDHVQIGPGAIIGHDSRVDDFAVIAQGAIVCGWVHVARGAYVGAGAMIRQRQEVGELSLVGLGAVVVHDVPARVTVVGNPARPLAGRQPARA